MPRSICWKSKTKFKLRHSNHKQEVKKKIGGLGHHYGDGGPCSYEHMSIQLIEKSSIRILTFWPTVNFFGNTNFEFMWKMEEKHIVTGRIYSSAQACYETYNI